jgi:5'-deoxynucleotidase YfbR-like HD superfamily hydrolase
MSGAKIRVYPSGKLVDPTALLPEDIRIHDIAHSLSNQCRCTGHSPQFYSVAQHSVTVASLIEKAGHGVGVQLAGLLHDASEAYWGDVASPTKNRPEMRWYKEQEAACSKLLLKHFGVWSWANKDIVDSFDKWAYELEVEFFKHNGMVYWPPAEARDRFTSEFYRLTENLPCPTNE